MVHSTRHREVAQRQYSLDRMRLGARHPSDMPSVEQLNDETPSNRWFLILTLGGVVLVMLAITTVMHWPSESDRFRQEAYQRYSDLGEEPAVRMAVDKCHPDIFKKHRQGNGELDTKAYWSEMDRTVQFSLATTVAGPRGVLITGP